MKNINKLKKLGNLRKFVLRQIPEVFDIEDLDEFITNQSNTKILFDFASDISEEYKEQLDDLIDSVLASENIKCEIRYDGQDEEKYNIMNYHCEF